MNRKLSYQKPVLQVHGSVEELTLGGNSGSARRGRRPRRKLARRRVRRRIRNLLLR